MSLAEQRLTPLEYLEIERNAEIKSEFFDGRMYAMAGTNEWHDTICTNVATELRIRFKNRPCRVYSSDMRVKVSATGLYTYPDVSALCGAPSYEDGRRDNLLNPDLIVEVLSPTTERYDRGEKFAHYRRVESITDYILIAQDKVRVEHYVRQEDGRWLLTELDKLSDAVDIASLQVTISLADIYDKVDLQMGDGQSPGHP